MRHFGVNMLYFGGFLKALQVRLGYNVLIKPKED